MEKDKIKEKDPPGVGVFTSKKMSETFLRTLECPVCLEIVIPPVISCTMGHIICSMCRPKLSKCGLCQHQFTAIRNYPIEAMLALVETDCRYNSCPVKLMADKMKDHLGVCDYRPVPCNETSLTECKGSLINFEDFPRHLMEIHGKSYVDLTAEYPEFVVYDVSAAFHGPPQLLGVMNYKNKTFFLRREYVYQRSYAMCWITVMASEKEARKYTFHLKITEPRDHKRSMEWRIRAHSIHATAEQMKLSGDCAFIPYDALAPFCERKCVPTQHGNNTWEYKWSMIGKITESEFPQSSSSHSISQVTSVANNVPSAQIGPLNLCSTSTNNNPVSTSNTTAATSSTSSNHNHSVFNHHAAYFPTPSPIMSFQNLRQPSGYNPMTSFGFSNEPIFPGSSTAAPLTPTFTRH